MVNFKKVAVGVLLVLSVTALCACQQSQDAESSADNAERMEKTENVISDVTSSGAETHTVIKEHEFSEGEKVENPYYKRTTNPDGEVCYEVVKAGDGTFAYLPMNDTVVYSSDTNECFYETVTLSYNLDGIPVTATQYQLYVSPNGVANITDNSDEGPKAPVATQRQDEAEEPELVSEVNG